jgi:hypothetical protein
MHQKGIWECGTTDPHILNVSTNRGVKLHILAALPLQNVPLILMNRRPGAPQSLKGCCGEEKNLLSPTEIKRFLGCPDHSLASIMTELP